MGKLKYLKVVKCFIAYIGNTRFIFKTTRRKNNIKVLICKIFGIFKYSTKL